MQSIEQKDLYDYRFLSGVEFAPGGKAAAFVVSRADEEENGYQSHIWLWREGQAAPLTGLGAERSFAWLDENRLLFAASRTKAEKKRAEEGEVFTSYYAIDIRGGEAQKAFELPIQAGSPRPLDREKGLWLFAGTIDAGEPEEYKMSADQRKELAARRKEEADYEVLDEVPFWLNGGGFINKRRTALFLYNMNTGSLERLTAPLFDLSALAVLGGKAYWMGEEYAQKPALRQDLFCYDPADGSTRCLYSARQYDIEGLWAVGDKLAAMGTQHLHHGVNENCEFYRFDFEKADFVLWQHNEESLWNSVGSDCRYGGGTQQKAAGEWLYFTTTRRESSHLYRVGDAGIQPVITRTGSLDCFDICPETGEILLVGMYDMQLQELYRFDAASGEMTQLTHLNQKALEGKYMAQPQPLQTESQGVTVDGWVLLPKDYDPAKKYPAILDIHGGPKTVYGPVFYHEMQYWANLGYFVFFCNPTGSDGRGNEFADIRGKYGTVDYQNIMDFTDAVLAAWPAIDPARVGVTGGSYGGFMTNWIIGHTDRFVCAATQRSISNWISFWGVSDIGPRFAEDQAGADIFTGMEKLWQHSPLKYAGNVTTPTLFIHSDADYRCPIEQGLQLYTALVQRGVPARLCWFKGENHELSRSGKPKHRLRRLTEITNWMEKYTRG